MKEGSLFVCLLVWVCHVEIFVEIHSACCWALDTLGKPLTRSGVQRWFGNI